MINKTYFDLIKYGGFPPRTRDPGEFARPSTKGIHLELLIEFLGDILESHDQFEIKFRSLKWFSVSGSWMN